MRPIRSLEGGSTSRWNVSAEISCAIRLFLVSSNLILARCYSDPHSEVRPASLADDRGVMRIRPARIKRFVLALALAVLALPGAATAAHGLVTAVIPNFGLDRSEEHTSELQSRENL